MEPPRQIYKDLRKALKMDSKMELHLCPKRAQTRRQNLQKSMPECMGRLGASWGLLGASWGRLGRLLGRLGSGLGPLGGFLGRFWNGKKATRLGPYFRIDFCSIFVPTWTPENQKNIDFSLVFQGFLKKLPLEVNIDF